MIIILTIAVFVLTLVAVFQFYVNSLITGIMKDMDEKLDELEEDTLRLKWDFSDIEGSLERTRVRLETLENYLKIKYIGKEIETKTLPAKYVKK